MDAETISNALGGKKCGNGYIMCCVAHDDKNPSLSVADGSNGLMVYCHAGCSFTEITNALKEKGLWQISKFTPQQTREYIKKKTSTQLISALAHELHVLYQIVSLRECDEALHSDSRYKKDHPEFKPMPNEPCEREKLAVKTLNKLLGDIYG